MNCYVLAGGRSTRMRVPKATLPFAGSTFLQRAIDAAQSVFRRVVVVERSGAEHRNIETIFEEPHEDEAPIFGVQRALADARAKCVILAVDYPLMTTEFLADLVERFAYSRTPMLVPVADGYPHVLCAGYSHLMLPVIEARIASRQYDLRSFALGGTTFRYEGFELMNVNTAEDLKEAERLYERQRLLTSR